MSKVHDLTGQRFGRLVVVERHQENTKHGKARWVCECDCGNRTITSGNCLMRGHTKSCGCLVHENNSLYQHGLSHTRIHYIWRGMKDRCSNPNNTHYHIYGGRGITVCAEWDNDFMAFYTWSMNNGYQENLSIDRIDNDKGYSPDNCRWTTAIEQANNNSRNVNICINGETKTIAEWCRIRGMNVYTARSRLVYGYTPEEAIDPDLVIQKSFKNERNLEIYRICQERGVPYKLVAQRLYFGWDLERALTQPKRPPRKKRK